MIESRPVSFAGTEEERRANENTHFFDEGRCVTCDCNCWGTTKDYPCGANVPRETVEV